MKIRLTILLFICISIVASAFEVEPSPFLPDLQSITLDNVSELQELNTLGLGMISDLAWSHDGHYLAVASSVGILIYENGNWSKPIRRIEPAVEDIDIQFSHDDSQIFAIPEKRTFWGSPDEGDLGVFDITTGEYDTLIPDFTTHADNAIFSPDGRFIARVRPTAPESSASTIDLTNLATGETQIASESLAKSGT